MYSQMDTERSLPFVCSEAAEESYQKCILKNNKTLVYRSGASSIIVFTEISPGRQWEKTCHRTIKLCKCWSWTTVWEVRRDLWVFTASWKDKGFDKLLRLSMDMQKRLSPTQQSGDQWPCPAWLSSHGAEQGQKTHPGLPSAWAWSSSHTHWDLGFSPSYVVRVFVGGCCTPPESRNAYKMTRMKYLWMGSQDFFFFFLSHS